MLLKITGTCHTEGMGTVCDDVSRRNCAKMVFLMLTESESVFTVTLLPWYTIYIEL